MWLYLSEKPNLHHHVLCCLIKHNFMNSASHSLIHNNHFIIFVRLISFITNMFLFPLIRFKQSWLVDGDQKHMNPVFFLQHVFKWAVVGSRMNQLHKPFACSQVHKRLGQCKLTRKTVNTDVVRESWRMKELIKQTSWKTKCPAADG